MRVKITVEDSSERWITLEETEARELQLILNNIFKFGYKPDYDLLKKDTEASKAEESPETLREYPATELVKEIDRLIPQEERCVNSDPNHICTACPQFRSHI